MREVYRATAQNGRTGLAIVGPDDLPDPSVAPIKGGVRHHGQIEGHDIWEIFPDDMATTYVYVVEADCTAMGGVAVGQCAHLQGGRYASILLLSRRAAWREWGYKRRSARVCMYEDGARSDIPASVLAASGVIPIAGTRRTPPAAPAPLTNTALADALRAAGIRGADIKSDC